MAQELKTLVVFYSLGGNTHFIAKNIADAVGADMLELKRKSPLPGGLLKFVIGGFQSLFKIKPQLQPLDKNPADYDLIFLGTPVWAGNYNPAYRTLLSQISLAGKKIAIFGCCGNNTDKAFTELKQALSGNTIIGDITFKEPVKQDSNAPKAADWAKQIVAEASN